MPKGAKPWREKRGALGRGRGVQAHQESTGLPARAAPRGGKPDFNAAVLDTYEGVIDETYGAEDMGGLRRAVWAFVVAELKEILRRHRAA
jgi:hypothetical protein